MSLYLDQEAFAAASKDLEAKQQELIDLRSRISATLDALRGDWKSAAGETFFQRIDGTGDVRGLLQHLADYSAVFQHMSTNLQTASTDYEEVFRAAETVADAQL